MVGGFCRRETKKIRVLRPLPTLTHHMDFLSFRTAIRLTLVGPSAELTGGWPWEKEGKDVHGGQSPRWVKGGGR